MNTTQHTLGNICAIFHISSNVIKNKRRCYGKARGLILTERENRSFCLAYVSCVCHLKFLNHLMSRLFLKVGRGGGTWDLETRGLGDVGTLEIISYWSDKLSSILDYFTFDPQKKYFTNSAQKLGVICLSRPRIPARLRVPKSSRTTSPSPHVPTSPRPRVPTSPRPRVPESPRPRVPTSPRPHVPASPRPRVPTSQRPHVPESPRPQVP